MATEYSNLTTLRDLAKSAEARTPRPAPAVITAGSGLIDLLAMDRLAREAAEKANAAKVAALTSPPRPRSSGSDPAAADLGVEATAKRRRLRVLGAIGGGAAVVALGVVLLGSHRSAPPPTPARATVEAQTIATPPAPLPAAVTEPPPAMAPSPIAVGASGAGATKRHAAKAHHAGTHGEPRSPKLTKISSSGT